MRDKAHWQIGPVRYTRAGVVWIFAIGRVSLVGIRYSVRLSFKATPPPSVEPSLPARAAEDCC